MSDLCSWESYYPGSHRDDPLAYMIYQQQYSRTMLEAKRAQLIKFLSGVSGLSYDGFSISGPTNLPFNEVFTPAVRGVFEEFAIVSQALNPTDSYQTLEAAVAASRGLIEIELGHPETCEQAKRKAAALEFNEAKLRQVA